MYCAEDDEGGAWYWSPAASAETDRERDVVVSSPTGRLFVARGLPTYGARWECGGPAPGRCRLAIFEDELLAR